MAIIRKGYCRMIYDLHLGNCIDVMKTFGDNSVDSIVTDPPYELGFMGKSWDSSGIAFNVKVWQEALRVLKPGGHLIAFSGSRTYHRMAVAIEDAGFEIRDQIMWIYGSGFPKSLDISKAIDKAAGAEREVIGTRRQRANSDNSLVPMNASAGDVEEITAPATDAAKQWHGWGTALKPAHEPMVLARKPLIGTVAANVLTHGTGGLNIDGTRVPGQLEGNPNRFAKTDGGWAVAELHDAPVVRQEGRWPANVIHDGSEEVVEYFGEPQRFFYCAKASKRDRNEGLDKFETKYTAAAEFRPNHMEKALNGENGNPYGRFQPVANHHPTVKPTDLMQYLCRLITPPNGIVLDPFMGSGSTGKAAMYENFRFIGIDLTPEYIEIAKARIEFALQNKGDALF